MRSLFLSRLSRLSSLTKPSASLGFRHLVGTRFLSGTPLYRIVRAASLRDEDMGRLVIRVVNGSNKDEVLEKKVPMSLMTETGTIGASHGWVATLKDGVICLQDDLNPNASGLNPKRITLPPLVTLPHCQTQEVTNVAMSSSSPEDEDCIVAVKFLGPQLSLYGNGEWVNYRITDPSFFSSRVMYSKSDEMFSMLVSGGTHIGSWDLEKHILQKVLHFPGYEEFTQWEWERVSMLDRTEHLVVSPTGERFLVKWYTECLSPDMVVRSKYFMVFEILSNQVAVLTNYIGDRCIFLSSKGEPFCLQASLHGLEPNSIYFVGRDFFGRVSISDEDSVRVGGVRLKSPAPYFIPPHQCYNAA